jgi:hypothetical protein
MLRRGFKAWCEKAALGFRRDLSLHPDAKLDPRRLAQHLGIPIWTPDQIPGLHKKFVRQLLETDPDSWSAATLVVGPRTVILSNSSHEPVRQNSNLAHELAHVILKHPPGQVFVTADGQMMMREYNVTHEDEAGCLSGTLLVPRQALLKLLARRISEADAAKHFAVSVDLLRMRKNLTGISRQLSHRISR